MLLFLWGYSSVSGTENLIKSERIVKKEGNVKTFKENFNQPVEKLGLSHLFVFQHDSDPKHTSLLVKNYFQKTKVSVSSHDMSGLHKALT